MTRNLQAGAASAQYTKIWFSLSVPLILVYSAACFGQTAGVAIIDSDFDADTGGFNYSDDGFRNTN